MKEVESDFAVDSSGFTTCKFTRWFDVKYGVTREKADWVKVHICCGVKTNVIAAVEIKDKDAADVTQLPALVEATAKGFKISEVSADKAYAATDCFNAVEGVGGKLYAAFKSNATGGVGGIYEKMFHLFSLNREAYLQHYHKRSNVESTFSMVKRKFGDALRSKTDDAMVNEALAKLLCAQFMLSDIRVVRTEHRPDLRREAGARRCAEGRAAVPGGLKIAGVWRGVWIKSVYRTTRSSYRIGPSGSCGPYSPLEPGGRIPSGVRMR